MFFPTARLSFTYSMDLINHADCLPFHGQKEYQQLSVFYEQKRRIVWCMLHPTPRPCFTVELLIDLNQAIADVQASGLPVDFWVTGSTTPQIFNLGGDLAAFVKHIRAKNKEPMINYARACVEAVYLHSTGFGLGAISIAMVEGAALGGGLEAALAHNYILAQQDVKLGFPEIAFNLYPGMGAYSYTARKTSPAFAEKLISTGESHTAEWLATQGFVDRTFEPGTAFKSTRSFIDELRPKLNGTRGLLRMRQRVAPVSREELLEITDGWAEAAFNLQEHELAYMERLVLMQNKRLRRTV
ncbi:MAG: crotonase/enoyl-CoA hydratase family protein [Agitococcus sp.]|nr:crotonase/enoyl-CoA hydratase family protein [Agitococcus sp.]MDO9177079.1 crotonase/enoyl-CoA hydratase family protein [Agitococcus sp.]